MIRCIASRPLYQLLFDKIDPDDCACMRLLDLQSLWEKVLDDSEMWIWEAKSSKDFAKLDDNIDYEINGTWKLWTKDDWWGSVQEVAHSIEISWQEPKSFMWNPFTVTTSWAYHPESEPKPPKSSVDCRVRSYCKVQEMLFLHWWGMLPEISRAEAELRDWIESPVMWDN
jgi:hypothetical protein